MSSDMVLVTRDGAVALVTLHRPESLNALDLELVGALGNALAELGNDATARAVVLTGSGRAFCAGGDVKSFVEHLDADLPAYMHRLAGEFHARVVLPLRQMPKPVVAAVNGVVAGGGVGLALACDLRIASDVARFALAYPSIGLTVDGGGSFFLPRLVGLGRAAELLLIADPVDAAEALRIGLVNRVVTGDELLPQAVALAHRLAEGPTAAFAMIKELLDQSFARDLPTQLHAELMGMVAATRTSDHRAGLLAFAAKGRPTFEGR